MEIWLTADTDNIFVLPGFHCFNLYRDGLGGGIRVYVRDSIQSKIIEHLTFINDLFEMLTVELLFSDNKVVLTSIYHPPTSSILRNNDLIDSLAFYLDVIAQTKLPLIVAGDMNINLLNPNNYVYMNTFLNSMLEFGLSPVITVSTKINTGNVITRFFRLDPIWISHSLQHEKSFVNPIGITDHFPVGMTLKLPIC